MEFPFFLVIKIYCWHFVVFSFYIVACACRWLAYSFALWQFSVCFDSLL